MSKKHIARAATILPLAIGLASSTPGTHATSGASESSVTPEDSALHIACTLPFDSIKQAHAIDETCGAPGSATETSPQGRQNAAKNSFCRTGKAVPVDFQTFDRLMTTAKQNGIPFGSSFHLPPDRSLLQSLISGPGGTAVGEGTIVRLSAFVLDAHYSNTSKGESVNCGTPGQDTNDIHIVLGDTSGQDPCLSVTAEMSPHFRPDQWTPESLNHLASRPLRFTGPLFFDAAHTPCSTDQSVRSNPPRRSLFEIHPVYSVDVCKVDISKSSTPIEDCDANVDANWVPFEAWSGDGTSEGSSGQE